MKGTSWILIPTLRPNFSLSLLFEHGRKYLGRSGAFNRRLSAPQESVLGFTGSPCSQSALASVPNGGFSGRTTCPAVPPFRQNPGKVEFSSVDDTHDKTRLVQRVSRFSAEMIRSVAAVLTVRRSALFGLDERAGRCGRGLVVPKPSFCARMAIARLLEIYG